MDRVVGQPRHASGVVWLPVRVDAVRFDVGAVHAGEWNLCHMHKNSADYRRAKELAEAYEREHAAELAPLFAQAAAWRKAHP